MVLKKPGQTEGLVPDACKGENLTCIKLHRAIVQVSRRNASLMSKNRPGKRVLQHLHQGNDRLTCATSTLPHFLICLGESLVHLVSRFRATAIRKTNCCMRLGEVPAESVGRKIRNPNPPAATEAGQASSEGGGHEPPAGDGATRRPEADSKSEIRNQETGYGTVSDQAEVSPNSNPSTKISSVLLARRKPMLLPLLVGEDAMRLADLLNLAP